MFIKSIRGAITIEHNTKTDILKNTEVLLLEMIEQNNLKIDSIINIMFTATKDITKAYPAIATRNIGIVDCPIMCVQELDIENSLPMCIRVMFTITSIDDIKPNHIYLKDARKLRPDLFNILSDKKFAVAIDGPAGTGKSTVAKIISKELNFIYIDTGALYRGITYYCLSNNLDIMSEESIKGHLANINLAIKFENTKPQIYLNNNNITQNIRTEEISQKTSIVAQYKSVRDKLLDLQRNIAKYNNVIMDGRDIGTNILPSADVKIYLDADSHTRAVRRYNQLEGERLKDSSTYVSKSTTDLEITLVQIEKSIVERDFNDKNRDIAPLKIAGDATLINTTNLSIDEVCEKIILLIKQKF
ncbi:MAG: (d)CMP kinase [bacterium]